MDEMRELIEWELEWKPITIYCGRWVKRRQSRQRSQFKQFSISFHQFQ